MNLTDTDLERLANNPHVTFFEGGKPWVLLEPDELAALIKGYRRGQWLEHRVIAAAMNDEPASVIDNALIHNDIEGADATP